MVNGYEPGVTKPFTPKTKASWTSEFERLLNESGMSRNELTDHLIQLGIKNYDKNASQRNTKI